MEAIKKLISKLTKPKYLHVDELGNNWVVYCGLPTFDNKSIPYMDYSYSHTYRSVEQNSIGWWIDGNTWLGTRNPLPLV